MAKNPNRVAALYTDTSEILVIRANPTAKEVKGFVAEHERRYCAGELGGPGGEPARHIHKAAFFAAEEDIYDEESKGTTINLEDVLEKF